MLNELTCTLSWLCQTIVFFYVNRRSLNWINKC